jgi:subtilisin-like proprotein convertase family protein
LDDDAGYPSQSTITGTAGALSGNYSSVNALSAFIGQVAAGTWTLTAIDKRDDDFLTFY